MQRVYFLPFCAKKAQGIENRSELQNLHFQHGEGPLQMSGPANGVPRSGKDLRHVDTSDSRFFASYYGIHLSSRDSKTKGLPHSFYCCLFFKRLFTSGINETNLCQNLHLTIENTMDSTTRT